MGHNLHGAGFRRHKVLVYKDIGLSHVWVPALFGICGFVRGWKMLRS